MDRKKVCLISSSGGHFEQLLMLKSLCEEFDIFFVTEKTTYTKKTANLYFVKQVNRHDKFFLINMIIVFVQSLRIFLKEKPDVIISTGALSVIPFFFLGKFFKKRLFFIESYAKLSTPTLTGKIIYKFADKFFVQWESLLTVYPDA
ncbi:polysaccharide biosynthesis protein [Enterococcus faecium]|nr:polysaccharide biosynthesis protein [Enterococcus faecium]